MIYKKPILYCFASPSRKLSCQDGSGASATASPNCTNGPINNPDVWDCRSGGLPTDDCLSGTQAGTSNWGTFCVGGGEATDPCQSVGSTPETGINYNACQSGTGVIGL